MTSFTARSLSRLTGWLRRADTAPPRPGAAAAMEGAAAIAAVEAALAQAAALGGAYPASLTGLRWDHLARAGQLNAFGARIDSLHSSDGRGALAAAMGAASAGVRTTCFLAGPDLLAAQDLLMQAAGRHLPLVAHIACRGAAAQGETLGSSHEAWHAASGSGWLQLFATSSQEAADLAVIARQVAERTLVPAMVAADGEQTLAAVQDLALPDRELIAPFLGRAGDMIESPTEAQRMLFGPSRRRLVRLHDLDRPMLTGSLQGGASWAMGQAGQRPYFAAEVPAALAAAFEAFARETGRRYAPLFEHRLNDAEIVLVAQGAAVETVAAAADALRKQGVKVGVLGIRCLRPLPAKQIAQRLARARHVAVLERLASPIEEEGPLLADIRAAMHRQGGDAPGLTSVFYGLGGLPLRAADLAALVERLAEGAAGPLWLGLDFTGRGSRYPQRQAMIDRLRRAYPDLAERGVRGDEAVLLRPRGAVTAAVERLADDERGSLIADAGALLHELLGGSLRSRAGDAAGPGEACTDLLTWSPDPLRDPGDDVRVDLLVLLERGRAGIQPLSENATVLAPPELDDDAAGRREAMLGSLLAGVFERAGRDRPDAAKLIARREQMLAHLGNAEREARLNAFEAGLASPRRIEADELSDVDESAGPQFPAQLERARRGRETMDSPLAFWNRVGLLHHRGESAKLSADPWQTVGAVPALTASLRPSDPGQDVLPVFDPATCDGRSRLWTSCPDASLAPLVISARNLLSRGMELANEAGRNADALRPALGKLAKRMNRIMGGEHPPATAGELMWAAFDTAVKEDDPQRDAQAEALEAAIAQVGDLPVARTEVFFDAPERDRPGSGELLSIVVNPDACRTPDLLLARCEGRGLRAEARTPERVEQARRLWQLWQKLPDTSGDTIERAAEHPDVGRLGAMLLSRHCLLAMTSGSGGEPASGARLALRYVLAAAEYHLQPRWQKMLSEVGELQERLSAQLRTLLADSLPADDLDAIARGVEQARDGKVDLAAMQAGAANAADAARIERLVTVARGLAEFRQRLAEGPSGLGRSRSGMALAAAGIAGWAAVYPWNPFAAPASTAPAGETGGFVRGLVAGQMQQAMQGLHLVRWARLELDDADRAADLARQADALSYDDLSPEERELCPPLLLVADEHAVSGRGQLTDLLESGLPVKLIVLAGAGGEADATGAGRPNRLDLGLLATLTREAMVVQSSVGAGDHLAAGVLESLAFAGPAMIHVHAPSPQKHGFAPGHLFEQAEAAVTCRAWPLFTFDPRRAGVFGRRLDLAGNPEPQAVWAGGDDEPRSPVHWAAGEARFAPYLSPLDDAAGAPTPLTEYLELPASDRAGRTPFVTVGQGDAVRRLRVADRLVADAEQRIQLWRTLQELAGAVMPFSGRLREQIERELSEAHEAEIARLKQEHEQAIAELAAKHQAETARQVTDRLMTLAGYDPARGKGAKS
ncbi:MAG: transketolase C-terminal domain-containing protein [Phycisphaeraceae bacterium]